MIIKSTAMTFIEEIDKLCLAKNIEYIDAVVYWCEKNGLEVELAADLIKRHPLMKSKIQVEAENLNYLKRSARLPI